MIDAGLVAEADELNAIELPDDAVTGKVGLDDAVVSEGVVVFVTEVNPVEDKGVEIIVGTLIAVEVGIIVGVEVSVAEDAGVEEYTGVDAGGILDGVDGSFGGLFLKAGANATAGGAEEDGTSTGVLTAGGAVDEGG